jgi:hypothetical protein
MVLIYAVVWPATDVVVLSEACNKDLKNSVGPAFLELFQNLRDQHPLAEGNRRTFAQKDDESTINTAVVDDFMRSSLGEAEETWRRENMTTTIFTLSTATTSTVLRRCPFALPKGPLCHPRTSGQ